jgi:hypothetical protein
MNKGLFASFDKLALRKNMMPTDLRDIFFRREESRSSLHALLKSPSFIYAASGPKNPKKWRIPFVPADQTFMHGIRSIG